MNCQQLKKDFNQIKNLQKRLVLAFKNGEFNQTKILKQEIRRGVESLKQEIYCVVNSRIHR